VERQLPTLPKHMRLPPDLNGVRVARSLGFCAMFYRSLFVLFLLATVFSVLLRYTASDYPFDFFKYF
jgi:hypothetical protein